MPGFNLGDSIPLSRISLRGANLIEADMSQADLTEANLSLADLTEADLSQADLIQASMDGADLAEAEVWDADLSYANLWLADLTEAELHHTDLTEADLYKADLTEADLQEANLTETFLWKADLTETILRKSDMTGAYLQSGNLSEADLSNADLTEADLSRTDLTEANLQDADLTDADLERAKLIGVNLFDANLTRIRPYGARFTGVQINNETDFYTDKSEYARWWHRGPFSPPPRCGYDSAVIEDQNGADADLTKAADTYKQFEKLASDNTLPVKESSMFILRQDIQRKRHRLQRAHIQHVIALISGGVFRYGESLARIFTWALLLVFGYAAAYDKLDLIVTQSGEPVSGFVDALYFSTLTFTALGLGDFKPDPSIQLARALVTSQAVLGAILIAIFVFVLGRRAAR